tara:strand:- start:546 stop:713 length:168 start_codon:yes stop_codon:yes gene_type:complete
MYETFTQRRGANQHYWLDDICHLLGMVLDRNHSMSRPAIEACLFITVLLLAGVQI